MAPKINSDAIRQARGRGPTKIRAICAKRAANAWFIGVLRNAREQLKQAYCGRKLRAARKLIATPRLFHSYPNLLP